jgi:hypothetical protein
MWLAISGCGVAVLTVLQAGDMRGAWIVLWGLAAIARSVRWLRHARKVGELRAAEHAREDRSLTNMLDAGAGQLGIADTHGVGHLNLGEHAGLALAEPAEDSDEDRRAIASRDLA